MHFTHNRQPLLCLTLALVAGCTGSHRPATSVSKVPLSTEDKAILEQLRQDFSSGVIDSLIATGDYTRSGHLDVEALRKDAEQLRQTKLNRLAERDREREEATPDGPSVIESNVAGEFKGFDGTTVIRLMDGSIWEQSEFYWQWHWAYMPHVVVYRNSNGDWKMSVDGISRTVGVRRLQ